MSASHKTAQQLQDASRVLLGLALALQHTASHEAKLLTHHAHIFHHSNKHAFNSAQRYAASLRKPSFDSSPPPPLPSPSASNASPQAANVPPPPAPSIEPTSPPFDIPPPAFLQQPKPAASAALAAPTTPRTTGPTAGAPSTSDPLVPPAVDIPPPAFLRQPAHTAATVPPPPLHPLPPPLPHARVAPTVSPASPTTTASTAFVPPPFDVPAPAFPDQPSTPGTSTPPLPSPPPPPSVFPAAHAGRAFELRPRAVPSTPMGRVLGFGGIAMRMLGGTVVDATKRIWSGDGTADIPPAAIAQPPPADASAASAASASPSAVSRFLSPANTERLAEGLCRMRGAALKIGQMLSIQDDALLPPALAAVLARVRDSADMMPAHQLRAVLSTEWGDDWDSRLERFDEQPIAAASIGQVHRGAVRGVGEVVVKVQYPGVADSIESDVENVRRLINWFHIAPKGLYLDKTMDAAKEELGAECDYRSEAANQTKFRALLRSSPLHPRVSVPAVVEALCTRQVLVSEWVDGAPIDRLGGLPQATRDALCRDLVHLCLLELFQWRTMQTDPNWSNFLYSQHSGVLHLVDFGACIAYRKSFIDDYLRMVHACAEGDRAGVVEHSRRLGFITGDESREMMNAHVAAAFIIGEPFSARYAAGYDFAAMNMSGRVGELARVMVRLRLTAPPKESYTLHRKLSGAFLTCKKLQANISLRDLFLDVYRQYKFD